MARLNVGGGTNHLSILIILQPIFTDLVAGEASDCYTKQTREVFRQVREVLQARISAVLQASYRSLACLVQSSGRFQGCPNSWD